MFVIADVLLSFVQDLFEEQVVSISLDFEPFEAESVLKKLADLLCHAVRP